MAEAKSSTDRRDRGRPQLRPDDETRQIIYEAARHEFAANGYAATSTETVARRAGVSTKTLYRLVPNKAALFEGMVSDRLDRFLSDFNLQVAEDADIEAGLNAALMAYADLGARSGRRRASTHHPAGGRPIPRSGGDVLQERHCPHRRRAVEMAAPSGQARAHRPRQCRGGRGHPDRNGRIAHRSARRSMAACRCPPARS